MCQVAFSGQVGSHESSETPNRVGMEEGRRREGGRMVRYVGKSTCSYVHRGEGARGMVMGGTVVESHHYYTTASDV